MAFANDNVGETIQKSLLTGQWRNVQSQAPLVQMAKAVTEGAFRDVLSYPFAREVLTGRPQLDLPLKESFLFDVPSAGGEYDLELIRLVVAVAALHAFVQANWTGPDLDFKPFDILPDNEGPLTDELLHQKSVSELAYGGEPAYHLAQVPFFLRLAQLLLDLEYHQIASIDWWRLRIWNIHQQILDEPVPLPPDSLSSLERLAITFGSEPDLIGRLWLERGLLDHYQSNDKSALEYFIRAARATDLQYELTGALGKRTKFQQTDLSQLVLLAESRKRDVTGNTAKSSATIPDTLQLNDDTLLEHTQYTSSHPVAPGSRLSHLDPSSQPALHPLDQSILLSLCLNVRNTSPSHGLTNEQMSPYIARVISHPENWSIHTVALLLRSRLESNRTRTVERSTLQLQALVDQMATADSTLAERLLYVHAIPLPNKWEMEKELALRFLSIGVVKSALEIFEKLEMWEEAAKCFQSMEQRDKALKLVHDLLEGRKAEAEAVITRGKVVGDRRALFDAAREAKLWCLLGELEPDQAADHFHRAWTVSKGSSGRAMRSLGGFHFARGQYADAIVCLRRAVAINPLLSRSWFILGCACVREEDWFGAKDAFARAVAIDDEDGESWNNLASVYLRMDATGPKSTQGGEEDRDAEMSVVTTDDSPSSVPFANKMLAFRALKQGLKFSFENWRMWTNYMIVAMDVGELAEACRALGRIVEQRYDKIGAETVDEDVLDRLVDAVTRAPSNPDEAVEGGPADNALRNSNEGHGLLKWVEDLFERILLPRVASPRIFRARARLLTWQERWEDALQSYLEAYRTGVAGKMEQGETEVGAWREAVREVEEIVDVLRNFGPKAEGFNWEAQAKSVLRTFMGRSRDFEEEPEWSRLVELQDELKGQS